MQTFDFSTFVTLDPEAKTYFVEMLYDRLDKAVNNCKGGGK